MQGHKMKKELVKYIGEWCQGEGIEKAKRKPKRTEYKLFTLSSDH